MRTLRNNEIKPASENAFTVDLFPAEGEKNQNVTRGSFLRAPRKVLTSLLTCRLHKMHTPNGHTTSNTRGFDIDITSIRRRSNFDEFPRHFHVHFRCNFADLKIHVVSTYFFRCNFDGQKVHVFSTYFFGRNFVGRKIHVVSTFSSWRNFAGRIIHVFSTYFFRCNFDGRKIHVVSTHFF